MSVKKPIFIDKQSFDKRAVRQFSLFTVGATFTFQITFNNHRYDQADGYDPKRLATSMSSFLKANGFQVEINQLSDTARGDGKMFPRWMATVSNLRERAQMEALIDRFNELFDASYIYAISDKIKDASKTYAIFEQKLKDETKPKPTQSRLSPTANPYVPVQAGGASYAGVAKLPVAQETATNSAPPANSFHGSQDTIQVKNLQQINQLKKEQAADEAAYEKRRKDRDAKIKVASETFKENLGTYLDFAEEHEPEFLKQRCKKYFAATTPAQAAAHAATPTQSDGAAAATSVQAATAAKAATIDAAATPAQAAAKADEEKKEEKRSAWGDEPENE